MEDIAYSYYINSKYNLNYNICYLYGKRELNEATHIHNNLELSIVAKGSGKYYIGDRVYDMQKDDVFIINNIEKHGLVLEENESMKNIVIHFEPRFIWSDNSNFDSRFLKIFFDRSKNFSHRLDRNNPATKEIVKLFYELEAEFVEEPAEYELMVKVKLMNILVLLLRHYKYVKEEDNSFKREVNLIEEVTHFIHDNYKDDIRLRDLADIAHMNESYFSTFFKRFNGLTPSEYIARIRIVKAIELIRQSDKSILEISTLCGFNSSASFNKMFKKVTGQTPSYYRNIEHDLH